MILFQRLFGLIGLFMLGEACDRKLKSNLLVLDGINVAETPAVLVELEAMRVRAVVAVSMNDLREFGAVRMIAKEASLRGHELILSGKDNDDDDEDLSISLRKEWDDLLNGFGGPLKYTTAGLKYSLDLSPDHVTSVPQLVKDQIRETPSIGRIIYLNSFTKEAKSKAVSAIQAYQAANFKFVTLQECLQ